MLVSQGLVCEFASELASVNTHACMQGIPMFLGAWLAIDMSLGSAVLLVWEHYSPAAAEVLAPAVASGLIVGSGVWSVPASLLSIVGVQAPLCMGFLPFRIGAA